MWAAGAEPATGGLDDVGVGQAGRGAGRLETLEATAGNRAGQRAGRGRVGVRQQAGAQEQAASASAGAEGDGSSSAPADDNVIDAEVVS